MTRYTVLTLGLTLLMGLSAGCSKPVPAPESELEPDPEPVADATEFSFTDTSETVSAEDLRVAQKQAIEQKGAGSQNMAVEADFNKDGLDDLALVEESDDGFSEVAVYIRKESKEEDEDKKIFYYRGGVIPSPGDGEVRGIIERRGKDFTDLVVLVSSAGMPNEIILYGNDGSKFVRQED